jgi:Fe-S-cluster-containing dehydrogenase component
MANALSITINPEQCRGCRRCEVACASHDPGPLNPRLAGIQIMKLDEGGSDYPVMNVECLERFCGKTAPRNKTKQEPACVSACLFGALQMNRKDGENE